MLENTGFQSGGGAGTGHRRPGRWLLLWLAGLVLIHSASAATFTATLDRTQVTVGESALLTLKFSGGKPDALPSMPTLPGLRIADQGAAQQYTVVNGQFSAIVSQSYALTPTQPGEFTIPSLAVRIDGQVVTSQAVKLVAVRPSGTTEPLALMKLVPSKTNVFVGEAFSVDLQVFIREGVLNADDILQNFDAYNGNPLKAEGFSVTRTAHRERRRAQIGTSPYTVSTLVVAVSALKPGALTLNSFDVDLTLQLPIAGRRVDPFDAFGGFFGRQSQPQRVMLTADPVPLAVLEVPREGAPPSYNGAIGTFELSVAASPTNVSAGDPITLKITVTGQGALDTLAAPQPQGWSNFKLYPPSSKLESKDPLQLTGSRIFEQVVSPENADVQEIPAVHFSFFDPEGRQYRTLSHRPIPIVVKPVGAAPLPSVAVAQSPNAAPAPATRDIVHIKIRPGSIGSAQPLVGAPWFLALQAVPVLGFVAAVFWRKRQDAFARNPRLRRKQQVDKLIADGLAGLGALASGGQAEPFFAEVVRLLQERLGERLDLPAAAITEAVIDSHLRPRRVAEPALTELQELFQASNYARFAPVRDQQELQAFIPRLEKTLEELTRL